MTLTVDDPRLTKTEALAVRQATARALNAANSDDRTGIAAAIVTGVELDCVARLLTPISPLGWAHMLPTGKKAAKKVNGHLNVRFGPLRHQTPYFHA